MINEHVVKTDKNYKNFEYYFIGKSLVAEFE